MPKYDYRCDENGRTIEVVHKISEEIKTWGDLCRLVQCDLGDTDPACVVRKVFTKAPMANTPTGDSELKNIGFTKLVKRYDGTYENVTRTGTEKRFLDPKDPSSLPHFNKKISD